MTARRHPLLKTQQMKGLPFDLAENGFVFSSAEIARESVRRDRLEAAKQAEAVGFNLTEYNCRTSNLRTSPRAATQNAERDAL